MSNKPFIYQAPFPMGKDNTEYYLLTSDYVSVADFDGETILKVEPEALTLLAQQAFHDASFMLRPAHQKQVAAILHDPEASENDKYVALQFLRNSEIAAKGVLPTCQDTGTAIIVGKKGQRVWTGGGDEEALSKGVYNTYIEDNLRYSQNAPLDMYKEVNTGTNLPAQIDLYAVDGDEYKFLCVAKGGGSANKTYLYQETKALLTPGKLKNFLVEKMRTLGTAACPPYHIAFVIGGTSAETNLKTVKLASAHYYDELPTEGNEHGQAFRDIQLEQELLEDEKECSEHNMLVDLGRNDLGRIARPGTVNVERLMEVERFSHVMHLTSRITARLQPDLDALDVLAATFPAGTVSGAPKVRAMEIIAETEQLPRGPYAGCIGWLGLDDDNVSLDTGITIRSMWVKDGKLHWQAGGGIVFDSDPVAEWNEVYNKSAIMRTVLNTTGEDHVPAHR